MAESVESHLQSPSESYARIWGRTEALSDLLVFLCLKPEFFLSAAAQEWARTAKGGGVPADDPNVRVFNKGYEDIVRRFKGGARNQA